MISQELMLGDWIMLNPDLKEYYPFAGKPCMVIGLHDDDGAIKIEYDNGKYFWTDAEDDVLPIPLTQEILEKNGWEYNNYNNETEYEEEYFVDENGFDIHINGEKFEVRCIDAVNIQLKYLHELQHLLKLCEIEKTIKL